MNENLQIIRNYAIHHLHKPDSFLDLAFELFSSMAGALSMQPKICNWFQQVYIKRLVMPPHQVVEYHEGRIGEVFLL